MLVAASGPSAVVRLSPRARTITRPASGPTVGTTKFTLADTTPPTPALGQRRRPHTFFSGQLVQLDGLSVAYAASYSGRNGPGHRASEVEPEGGPRSPRAATPLSPLFLRFDNRQSCTARDAKSPAHSPHGQAHNRAALPHARTRALPAGSARAGSPWRAAKRSALTVSRQPPQPAARLIRANLLHIGEELAAHQLALAERDHQLRRRQTLPTHLHRPSTPLDRQLRIDQLNQPQTPGQLAGHREPRVPAQRRIVRADPIRPRPLPPLTDVTPKVTSRYLPWQASAPRQSYTQVRQKAPRLRGFLRSADNYRPATRTNRYRRRAHYPLT